VAQIAVQTPVVGLAVDSGDKLSQVSGSILSHWFKRNFGYSIVDKSTSVARSLAPFVGFVVLLWPVWSERWIA
jgi:hypothetical protein